MAETQRNKQSQSTEWLEKYSGENIELARIIQRAFENDSASSDPVSRLAEQLKAEGCVTDINDEVLGFLNSSAVRNHLKEIDYKLNAVEAAYLVYWSRTKSTVEKLCAWARIVDELPDSREGLDRCYILRDKPELANVGLHEILREYILKVVESLDSFFTLEDGCYYQSHIMTAHGELWDEWDKAYPSADSCIADALDDRDDEDEDFSLTIRKGNLFDKERRFEEIALLNNVLVSEGVFQDVPSRFEDLDYFFEGLWLPIPCPFKEGDIVYDPASSKSRWTFCNGMIVVTGSSYERFRETGQRCTDSSDMCIYGYFQNDGGAIYHEVTRCYLDMEYVPEEMLVGKSRVLLAVSKLLRDEIDVSLYSDVLLHVIFEELIKQYDITQGWWLQESLDSLGFPKPDRNS